MDMPKPTEAHRKLERLAGIWRGEEVMSPSPWDPQGGTALGITESRVALGGFAVIRDYRQERDGRVTFSGHGVYTYDPQQECYVLYWFDSMGMAPNLFKGHFEEEVLTLVSDESGPGGPRLSRGVYDMSKPGKMTSTLEVSQDGEAWELFMKGSYTRQE